MAVAFKAVAGAAFLAAWAKRQSRHRMSRRRARLAMKAGRATVAVAGAPVSEARCVGPGPEAVPERPASGGHGSGRRPKVVVLGSGWGAATFINELSTAAAQMYDITVVAPRNYFLYTPLLPSCSMGSVEEGSIVTPMRRLVDGKAQFLEAECEHVDTVNKLIRCGRAGMAHHRMTDGILKEAADGAAVSFSLGYDLLVYAVGAPVADLGCPGVGEHALFLRDVGDARRVRESVAEAFERAALPSTAAGERERLLSFVVVGGGPAGVEVAVELADFIGGEAAALYSGLCDHVRISLINDTPSLLAACNHTVVEKAMRAFEKKGVSVMNGHRVREVTPSEVKLKRVQDGEEVALRYGCLIWAPGTKEHPLTAQLKASLLEKIGGRLNLTEQVLRAPAKGIATDDWLQVRGSGGEIFALGDAAYVWHDRMLPLAQALFDAGGAGDDGALSMPGLRDLLGRACRDFPQLEEYALYLRDRYPSRAGTGDEPRVAAAARLAGDTAEREHRAWRRVYEFLRRRLGQQLAHKAASAVAADIVAVCGQRSSIDVGAFRELLRRVDLNLRPLPPTAQVAAQQGHYLAKIFTQGHLDGRIESFQEAILDHTPFTYFHKASLAYLGDGDVGLDLPVIGAITGPAAGLARKLYETIAQVL